MSKKKRRAIQQPMLKKVDNKMFDLGDELVNILVEKVDLDSAIRRSTDKKEKKKLEGQAALVQKKIEALKVQMGLKGDF